MADVNVATSEANIVLPAFTGGDWTILIIVLASALVGLAYGAYLIKKVMAQDPGPKSMQDVSAAVQEGASAYLTRQFAAIKWFILGITVALFVLYYKVEMAKPEHGPWYYIPLGIAIAFILGAVASYGAGYVGMNVAVRANCRVANAALSSFKKALELAFQAGTVSGMFTVGFGLLGATIIFIIFQQNAMQVLVGFGFGGCLIALFMRVGGGIYTKAADVGADLVGKIEKNIPEDDPRNAAVIADNVGDNVGDCAGMAADVFESYEVTLVAAIILAMGCLADTAFTKWLGGDAPAQAFAMRLVMFALLIRAVGVFASILGTWSVKGKDEGPGSTDIGDPMKPINLGYLVAGGASAIGIAIVNYLYLHKPDGSPDFRFTIAAVTGILLAVAILWITNVFTHPDKRAATETAYAAKTGPATLILTGFGIGLESTVWSIVAICMTIGVSFYLFHESVALAAYGVALSGLGLLTTTGFILAMDTYGPITDNANGIFEMSGIHTEESSRAGKIVARLDAIGNTTKALTKGLAIATAVIAAVSLFRSFIGEAAIPVLTGIQVNLPDVFIGLLIGGAVPFLFSSFAIKAVGRTAFQIVEEVRRQFRDIPGIMEGTTKPEYGKCVDIVTTAAQRELFAPGVLAIATPLLVAFALGAAALGGYLAGAILTGQLMAVFLSNTGGVWDNAKKKIEDGFLGGKGTDAHKAGVTGDTVGDPFKDTAGPALNPLIKVMNLIAILIAPVVAVGAFEKIDPSLRWGIAIACAIMLGIAVAFSKRGSIVKDVDPKTGELLKKVSGSPSVAVK
jgi:K(+)-stimulated pyrophosphate-energized sodium pump